MIIISIAAELYSQNYLTISTCEEMIFMYNGYSKPLDMLYSAYPACQNTSSADVTYVIVKGRLTSGRPEEIASIFSLSFGVALWLSLVIHNFAVEKYLWSTKDEDERLRVVSMKRRKAAGMVDHVG
jgi:hypothetical protein